MKSVLVLTVVSCGLLESCKQQQSESVGRHTETCVEVKTEKVTRTYTLTVDKVKLVQNYIRFYSSEDHLATIDQLLHRSGIGYVGLHAHQGSEIFRAQLEGNKVHVVGDQSAHVKIVDFFEHGLTAEYLEQLFAETIESYEEVGLTHPGVSER